MKALFLCFAVFAMSHFQSYAALCTSNLIGGDWNNPATWACGRVPGCGDDVFIPLGSIVTVTANVNLSACSSPVTILVAGELVFGSNRSISLPGGSCLGFFLLGTLVPSLNLTSTNRVIIGGSTEWSGTLLTLPIIGPAGIGCAAPLPVELASFELENREKEVAVSWESKSERNNDFYTLERSPDGLSWEQIAIIKGAGNSPESTPYAFVDQNPVSGQSYYRLSQTDLNGDTKILQSLANTHYGASYEIYPTLVSGTLCVKGKEVESARVFLRDNLGEAIELRGVAEAGKLVFDFSEIPNGNYFLEAQNTGISCVRRLVVIHD